MSHEIYYTSAPEGVKRGTSGFCTVAASENIPKPLWDRLETLSAYRHQFGSGGQANPVSLAHWILAIAGKSHHVLSRVCDSGVDHTQRTNAFAHHLVLEPGEITAAQGGPAWLLEQPGVMAQRWEGQVGGLRASPLARGDVGGSRICHAWAALTGDAGWGGHLADLFAKAPTRPVCILFAPGQELLPLLAESIALLPPAARWNVTFNTYFTSMPTSATCLWRCCLAGTPAAQTGLRYAANGLVLDLTDRARLPALPAGDYVTMARTGQSAAPAFKAAPVKTAQPALAELKAKAAPAARVKPGIPAPIFDPEGDEEERQAEERREAVFDFAPIPEEAAPQAPDPIYDLREDVPAGTRPVPSRTRPGPAPRLIRRAEDALEESERQAARAAQARRRQVLLLFGAALAALAVGTVVIIALNHNTAPPDLPPGPAVTSHPKPIETKPIEPAPDTAPITVQITLPPDVTTSAPAQTQGVTTAPQVAVPTASFPEVLTLGAAITRPELGTGFGDRQQSLPLKAADLAPGPITGLRLDFFPAQSDKVPAGSPATYKNKALGTLTAVPGTAAGRKTLAILWKPEGDPGMGTEVLVLACDPAKPSLELTWHAAALMRSSGSFNYIFWVLQNSALTLETAAGKQQIAMKPFSPGPLNFADPAMDLTWPADLPRDVQAVEPAAGTLPAGWNASWYLDWDPSVPTASRTTANACQVIAFKRPTAVAQIDTWFLLTFKPGDSGGIARVECTYAKTLQQNQADLAKALKDLADINKKITDLKNDPALATFGGGVPPDLMAKQVNAQATADAYNAAVSGYNELTQFDIQFELSDKVRLATLHFQRPGADTGK